MDKYGSDPYLPGPEQPLIAEGQTYSPFFGKDDPPQNQKAGTDCVGDKIPKVSLSLGDKPLMDFIGDPECDHTNNREAHTAGGLGGLSKRAIQKNTKDPIFARV